MITTKPMTAGTKTMLWYLAIAAAERGTGYWAQVGEYRCGSMEGPDDAVWFTLHEFDDRTGEYTGKHWKVDAAFMRSCCEAMVKLSVEQGLRKDLGAMCALILAGCDDVDHDSEDADVIVQAGCFGEIVYG